MPTTTTSCMRGGPGQRQSVEIEEYALDGEAPCHELMTAFDGKCREIRNTAEGRV